MARLTTAVILVAALIMGVHPARVWAQDASDFSGRWTLDRDLSQLAREIGFSVDWLPSGGSGTGRVAGGGRGGRRSGDGGTAGVFPARFESEADASRLHQLTDEARSPASHLTIVETPTAVAMTDDRGRSRTFHPTGKEEILQLDGVPVGVTARREAGGLVVVYRVEEGRELRYTYSHTASPPQLVVDVQFLERGGGDHVRRIYEPTSATAPLEPPAAAPSSTAARQGGGLPPATASNPASPAAPAVDHPPAQAFNQQPDAELKGLTKLGVVVEGLSPQAAACGLGQDRFETAVSKRLSDAGFKVLRDSDDDTYIYVNIITTSLPGGLCVSRYDASLNTYTTAKLSYGQTPVLVQVALLRKGGIVGGPSAAHGEAVLRGVQEYISEFSMRIHEANK